MLKHALLFAGAGLSTVLLAPFLLPLLERPGELPVNAAAVPVSPVAPVAAGSEPTQSFHELQVPDNGSGQYFVDAWVNGVSVRFLVDTGANIVSLSAETASRLGFADSPSAPHYVVTTANGQAKAYGVKLRTIDLGPIYVADLDATVNPSLGPINLLGENFLQRLGRVEQRDRRLILRQ